MRQGAKSRTEPARRPWALYAGVALSSVGLVGWTPEQVGIKAEHVVDWGSGAFNDPTIVSRDNPWFTGSFNCAAGTSASASGTYSNHFDWDPYGFIQGREYIGNDTFVDQWFTDLRPNEGEQIVGVNTSKMYWSVRSASLVHGNLMVMNKSHWCTNGSIWFSGATTLSYRLADDVLVVPIVAVSWISSAQTAGPAQKQDSRGELSSAIDFIPMKSSQWQQPPENWVPENSWDPEQKNDPPDEVFAICGVQFQVVRTFKFPTQIAKPPCKTQSVREFATDGELNNLITNELGALLPTPSS